MNKEIKDKELEAVSGGNTIKPKEDGMWYPFNPEAAYNLRDDWNGKA